LLLVSSLGQPLLKDGEKRTMNEKEEITAGGYQ
jgi:hypothetical protein